jgi:hypothetical protein
LGFINPIFNTLVIVFSTIMMTDTLNSNHVMALSGKVDIDTKMDDMGWKAKLKIPPKDRRIQTSVSNISLQYHNNPWGVVLLHVFM